MEKFILISLVLASTSASASGNEHFELSDSLGSSVKVYRNGNQFRTEMLIKRHCKGDGNGIHSEKIKVNESYHYMARYCFGEEYKITESYRHNSLIVESLKSRTSTSINGVKFYHGDAFNRWLSRSKQKSETVFIYEPWGVSEEGYAFTRSTSVDDGTIYETYLFSSGGFNFVTGKACNYETHVDYTTTINVNRTPVKVNISCIEGTNRIVYETMSAVSQAYVTNEFKRLNHVKVNDVVFSGEGFTKAELILEEQYRLSKIIRNPAVSIDSTNGYAKIENGDLKPKVAEPTIIYRDKIVYRDLEVALSFLILLASAFAFIFRYERNKALRTVKCGKEEHDKDVRNLMRKLTASEDLRKNQEPDGKLGQANDTIRHANERINQLKSEINEYRHRLVFLQDRIQTADGREIIANKRISELERQLANAQAKMSGYTQAEVDALLTSQEAELKRKYANVEDEPINFELGYYAIFGLKSDGLTYGEVKARYKQLSVIYHPDKCGSTEMMQRINISYDKLKKWHS